jgi:hypothetical protein
VAEDYFAAMERVEQRLDIVSEPKQETEYEVVNVQEPTKLFQLIQQLEMPELCYDKRLSIVCQLREELGAVQEHAPPETKRLGICIKINDPCSCVPLSTTRDLFLHSR